MLRLSCCLCCSESILKGLRQVIEVCGGKLTAAHDLFYLGDHRTRYAYLCFCFFRTAEVCPSGYNLKSTMACKACKALLILQQMVLVIPAINRLSFNWNDIVLSPPSGTATKICLLTCSDLAILKNQDISICEKKTVCVSRM